MSVADTSTWWGVGQDPETGFGMGGGGGSSFPWMSLLSAILPGLGSLFSNPLESSLNQLQGAESGLGNQISEGAAGLLNDFAKFFQPAMGAESSSVIGGLGQTAQNLGASNAVFSQEAATGLSPQVQANAMNQLLQGYNSSLSDLESQATPGSNLNAANIAAQDSYLSNAANQSAQLAGESQQFKNTGAQGLASNWGSAMSAAQGFTGQGIQLANSGLSSLDNLYNSMSNQAAAYAQAAGSQPGLGGSIGSILGSVLPFMSFI